MEIFSHTTIYLLTYIFTFLKFLICIHTGNPRVPPQVLASGPKPCGGNKTLKATSNYLNIPLEKVLQIASCFVTTATDHQTEHTLSPGTCALAKCNNQPGIQYSGVHPAASSVQSPARTLLFVLHLDHLNTNDVVKSQTRKSTSNLFGFASVTV